MEPLDLGDVVFWPEEGGVDVRTYDTVSERLDHERLEKLRDWLTAYLDDNGDLL